MSRSTLTSPATTGALAAVISVGAVACSPAKDSATDSDGKTTATAPTQQKTKKPAAESETKPAFKGSGTFEVGSDIQPGTYKGAGNTDGTCYREHGKDALHGTGSITANDNVTGNGVVANTRADAYVRSSDCGDWRKTG